MILRAGQVAIASVPDSAFRATSPRTLNFEELVQRYQGPLLRFLYGLVGDRELAADLCQERSCPRSERPSGSTRMPAWTPGCTPSRSTTFAVCYGGVACCVGCRSSRPSTIEPLDVIWPVASSSTSSTFVIPMELTRLLGQVGNYLDRGLQGGEPSMSPSPNGMERTAAPVTTH